MRKDEVMKLYPKINKVKKCFNWRPTTTLKSGIKTIKYYKKKM